VRYRAEPGNEVTLRAKDQLLPGLRPGLTEAAFLGPFKPFQAEKPAPQLISGGSRLGWPKAA
jgi:hypothetical protein